MKFGNKDIFLKIIYFLDPEAPYKRPKDPVSYDLNKQVIFHFKARNKSFLYI